jgi:hypothetical protein
VFTPETAFVIEELARGNLNGGKTMPRGYPSNDPDGFYSVDSSLQPDPVFMGLMAITRSGPLGALRRWIDRHVEAREDRQYGARIHDVLPAANAGDRNEAVALESRDRSDRDIAA